LNGVLLCELILHHIRLLILEKNHPQNTRIRQAAINILNYLRDHPQAKDTADGIARWWVHEDAQVVKDALGLLQEEGVVEKNGRVFQLKQNG